jgi:CRP/FNR family transcriptional regulator, cyclic AMP receptor protein
VSVSQEAWTRLLSAGVPRFYKQGAVLLRQGQPATHVLPLVAGRVKISRTSRDGSVMIIGVFGPGEILGDMAVLGEGDRSATVTAMDQCETRIIPAARFAGLVRSLGIEPQMFRNLIERIHEAETWRAELAALPAGPRLARTLIRLAIPGPDGVADIDFDKAELGQAAGLSRSTVAAELQRLRKQGAVATSRRRIVVVDLLLLRTLAEFDHGNV